MDQRDARKRFHEVRARRFADDGTRRMVLVVGTGLHHHLGRQGISYPNGSGATLRDWNGLLQAARKNADSEVDEFTAPAHDDPTATWESMLLERSAAVGGKQVWRHEAVLLGRLAGLIIDGTPNDGNLGDFGGCLHRVGYRDIVSLNFDRTVDRALAVAAKQEPALVYMPKGRKKAEARRHLRYQVGGGRVWHPHGVASPHVSHKVMQLGMVGYAKSVRIVQDAVEEFREGQRKWRQSKHGLTQLPDWTQEEAVEWHDMVRGASCASWVDLFMTSDLVFVGCGLDRAEGDLWLALHERQRQLRSVPERERPSAFFLHPLSRWPQHLTTRPAGLIPIITRDHDESWELVLSEE